MKQRGRFYFLSKSSDGKIEPSPGFPGFTLIELIVVVMIIGILVSFALPQFGVTKERTLDREAKASLALMRAAERIYKMEIGEYLPIDNTITSDINVINTDLKLSIPVAGNWVYSIDNTGSIGTNRAARTVGGSTRTWSLDSAGTSEDPACTPVGSCY